MTPGLSVKIWMDCELTPCLLHQHRISAQFGGLLLHRGFLLVRRSQFLVIRAAADPRTRTSSHSGGRGLCARRHRSLGGNFHRFGRRSEPLRFCRHAWRGRWR